MTAPTTDQQAQVDAKRLSTLRARLALRGIHCTAGGWLVCNHTMSRHCPTLEALEAFAAQVGAIR